MVRIIQGSNFVLNDIRNYVNSRGTKWSKEIIIIPIKSGGESLSMNINYNIDNNLCFINILYSLPEVCNHSVIIILNNASLNISKLLIFNQISKH